MSWNHGTVNPFTMHVCLIRISKLRYMGMPNINRRCSLLNSVRYYSVQTVFTTIASSDDQWERLLLFNIQSHICLTQLESCS